MEYRIRGHNLIDIATFLFEPERMRKRYMDGGYGEDFVNNQARIFGDFISGRAEIKLIAGRLDDTCRFCRNRENVGKNEWEIPCEDPRGIVEDTDTAKLILLDLFVEGKSYNFKEIERSLRNFYLDQHSM